MDPRNQASLCAAVDGAGVAESTDGGATWSWVNSGLGQLSVAVVTVGPGRTVYAGTSCGGIWWRRRP